MKHPHLLIGLGLLSLSAIPVFFCRLDSAPTRDVNAAAMNGQ